MIEPKPTIIIECDKVPVPGMPGQYRLEPRLTFTHMPTNTGNAWPVVHQLLCECLPLVAAEMVKTLQQRVQLVPMLPGELVKQ